jgi:hypothetical protein
LQSKGLSKIEIPFDSVGANIKLTFGSRDIEIKGAHGIKIVGKAHPKEEEAPLCDLHWRIPYDKGTWSFLGENFGNTVTVKITNRQTVMTFDDDDDEEDGEGKAPKAKPEKAAKAKKEKANKAKPGDTKAGEKLPDNVTPIATAAAKN